MESKQQRYILITSANFPEGGPGANYLNLFCRGLKLNGYEISASLLKGFAFGNYRYKGPRKNISDTGIPYTYLGLRQRPAKKLLKPADQFISFVRLHVLLFSLIAKRKQVSILLYNSDLFFNIPVHLIAKISGIRLIKFAAEIIDKSQYGNSIIGRISRAAYLCNFKFLNSLSDRLIVFSYYLKDEFTGMGYDGNKIFVQPNLTDFEYWGTEGREIKYDLGYSGAPYKKDGLFDLLKAIQLLDNWGLKATIVIVGDATFGNSLIPDLKEVCRQLGIEDRVTFTGLVNFSTVKNRLSECKILAITRPDTIQTKAGFPTKLGEYFATKRPILATKFGDMERYFTDGHDITLAQCDNPESIAQKIRWMLQNYEKLSAITARGYITAKELLEFKNAMKRVIEFLK